MTNMIISTDNTCDLTSEYINDKGIVVLDIPLMIDGVTYCSTNNNGIGKEHFYELMRAGSKPTTSLISPDRFSECFEKSLKEGHDVLHISFSSGISGTYNAANIAKNELESKYPNNKIVIVDSLSSSLGLGYLIMEAQKQKEKGLDTITIADNLNSLKFRINHLIAVDDLFHLCRGGRISKTSAIVGSALSFKPLINFDNEGHLYSYAKVIGRKKSLSTVADQVAKYIDKSITDVYIVHADCPSDAEFLKNKIEEKNIQVQGVYLLNQVLGTHVGPGMVATIFIGKDRNIK